MLKVVLLLAITTLAVVNAKRLCAGCLEPLDFQDAKHILNSSLAKLGSLDGSFYKSGQIHSATQQIVAGIIYRINADLLYADNKVAACDVKIQKEPGLATTLVTINCPNKEEIIKSYSA